MVSSPSGSLPDNISNCSKFGVAFDWVVFNTDRFDKMDQSFAENESIDQSTEL